MIQQKATTVSKVTVGLYCYSISTGTLFHILAILCPKLTSVHIVATMKVRRLMGHSPVGS
jgi:hypothetical protein